MDIEELAFKDRKTLANLNSIDLLDIIEFLQNDRKQWINQFTQTHNESVDIRKENLELKEKLLVAHTNEETFRLEMEDITKILGLDEDTIFDDVKTYVRSLKDTMFEKEQLKKQLEDKILLEMKLENELFNKRKEYQETYKDVRIEIKEYKTQQKEFIKWLEEKEKRFDMIGDPINSGACCGILQKYKKIIGVSDETNIK